MYQSIYYTLLSWLVATAYVNAQTMDSSQNLVPNPGFEQYYSLPSSMAEVHNNTVKYWKANPRECTPEYFHQDGAKGFRVPKNRCGTMPAHTGKAYVGLLFRAGKRQMDPRDVYYREHIMAKLKRPLKKKYRYIVKMYIALASYSNYAIANLGIYFNQFPEKITWDKKIEAHIVTPTHRFFDQRGQWMLVQDTIVAMGGEQYIMIGDFNSFKNRQIKKITNSTKHRYKFNYQRAYYYLDDVSVTELDKFEIKTVPSITLTQKHPPNKIELKTDLGKLQKGKPVILKNIFFEFAKARLLPESFPELNKLVDLLKKYPQIKIKVLGHTDDVGPQERNQKLSERRARSVVNYLTSKGIKVKRLRFKGFGEAHPIDTNQTKEGRQKNRRVEFMIL